ncbi:MAG: D-glycerate dehydrogenase [Steroidobacteraceae bacterium]|nr:D-glycerate dehydrogenase [Steroidobacteraceae bacterium]
MSEAFASHRGDDHADARPRRRPRLVVTRRLPGPVEERLARDYDVVAGRDDRPLTLDDWRARSAQADAVLCTPADRVSREVVELLPPTVRIVATFSVGYNHVDLGACAERGIVVTNTPDVLTDATADVALLLLLGAARRAAEGEALMRARAWTGWTPTQLLGTHVGGKSLGIVGYGRIGQAVARRALAFGMTVHYLSRREKADAGSPATWHPDETSFWPVCQFLSLHLPATPETRRYLDAARLARLPRGAIVVNTARGDVVDDDALIAALKSGHVAAAGLDVFDGEPDFRPEYADLPNTFLLPHLGSATFETRCAMGYRALDNLDAYFANREPKDVVRRG